MQQNPLLPGFHPDPSVVQVDDDYFLVTSTFEYRPGLPIYKSTDLANWELIGHVVNEPGLLNEDVPTGGGAWAPTIRHHEGLFYVIVTDAKGGRGTVIFTATDPAGAWSDPLPIAIDGIDPDLAWDNNGDCYVTYAALLFRPVFRHIGIQQVRIDLSTGAALEEPRDLWSGTGLKFAEAPHLYQLDGWWYMLIAEGGTDHGHAVSIARSRSITGPFEGAPHNPILSARSTDAPVQNTGHGDPVQAPDGSWQMVLLGTRNKGRGFSPLGRETFITAINWVDGWPEAEPVTLSDPAATGPIIDTFKGNEIGPHWLGVRRFPHQIATQANGAVTLRGEDRTMGHRQPTFIGRRVTKLDTRISMSLQTSNGVGGLCIRYDENHHYEIEIDGDTIVARARVGTMVDEECSPIDQGPLVLFIETRPPDFTAGMTSDIIILGFDVGSTRHELAAFDGRYLTAEVACSFTGRIAGPYCVTGELSFDQYSEEQCS